MTASVTVAVVGDRSIAKEFGKKGTSSDLTLYNSVHDDRALTIVEPTQYPEKLPPLLFSLAMADRALFVAAALDRELAETAATLDLFDLPVKLVLAPTVGEAELRRALKGTRLAEAPASPLDPTALRAELDGWTGTERPGPVQVRIDHAFPVRGVGAVALGLVTRGTLEAHARLRLFPTEKLVEVRSVQVHDVDVPAAPCSSRVGVALKGVDADELSRGQILAAPEALQVGTPVRLAGLRRCPYYRGTAGPGSALHLLAGLQLVPVRVGGIGPETLEAEADRPFAYAPGETVVLADLSAPTGPRLFGRGHL